MKLMSGFLLLWILLSSVLSLAEEKPRYYSFEERVLISYGIQAHGLPPEEKQTVYGRAVSYLMKLSQVGFVKVNVANFKDFLSHFRGDWPNTESLAKDLQIVESRPVRGIPVYYSSSPRIQKQMDAYMSGHYSFFLAEAAAKISQNSVASFPKVVDQFVAEKIHDLEKAGEKISELGFQLIQDPMTRLVLQTLFNEYYSRLSLDSKKQILSAFAGEKQQLSDQERFEMLIQNSGPQLQKLMQIVARQSELPENVLEVFKKLENSVREVPWSEVSQLLAKEKGNFEFVYFERKPLGVGTMAQVHRAKIIVNGKKVDVVVRFIKPGIAARIEEDHRVLAEVAKILDANPEYRKTGAPLLSPVVDDLTQTAKAELNQQETIERQKAAVFAYEREVFVNLGQLKNYLKFHVPRVYESKNPSQFMVQELVIGKRLDKEAAQYLEIMPLLKKIILESVAKVWVEALVFGTGFYHSDLHQGNFMVRVMDLFIQVNILDFGMGGTISKGTQTHMLLLGLGLETKNPKLLAEAFFRLSEKSGKTMSPEKLEGEIAALLQMTRRKGDVLSWNLLTAHMMNLGLRLPYDFINLNRGIMILEKSLAEAKSPLDFIQLAKQVALKKPVDVYEKLVKSKLVTEKELIQIGWRMATQENGDKGEAPKVVPTTRGAFRCEGALSF